MPQMRREMVDIGMDGWILKPIDFARLSALLKVCSIPRTAWLITGSRDTRGRRRMAVGAGAALRCLFRRLRSRRAATGNNDVSSSDQSATPSQQVSSPRPRWSTTELHTRGR